MLDMTSIGGTPDLQGRRLMQSPDPEFWSSAQSETFSLSSPSDMLGSASSFSASMCTDGMDSSLLQIVVPTSVADPASLARTSCPARSGPCLSPDIPSPLLTFLDETAHTSLAADSCCLSVQHSNLGFTSAVSGSPAREVQPPVKSAQVVDINVSISIYRHCPVAYRLTFWQSIFSRAFVTHTAVFFLGSEAAFNSDGIYFTPGQGKEQGMIFLRGWVVRNSSKDHEVTAEQLALSLQVKYAAGTYDCFKNNCNHFSNDLLMSLVGKGCPWWVKLPAQVAAAVAQLALFACKLFASVRARVGGPFGKQQQQPPPKAPKQEVPADLDPPSPEHLLAPASCASGDSPPLAPSPPTPVAAAFSSAEAAAAAAAAAAAVAVPAAAAAVDGPPAPSPQPQPQSQPADAAPAPKQPFKWHRPQWVKALAKKVQTVKGLFRKQAG